MGGGKSQNTSPAFQNERDREDPLLKCSVWTSDDVPDSMVCMTFISRELGLSMFQILRFE